jgi:hypothetical protein
LTWKTKKSDLAIDWIAASVVRSPRQLSENATMLNLLRKDLLLILAAAAVFLSLSYAIGFVSERPPKTVELRTAFLSGEHAPKAQPTSGRVWRKPAFEKSMALGSESVKEPTIMRADDRGNIYVLDWSDLRIKKFSLEGKLIEAFGEEMGSPGAFINPTGFSVDSAGNLWVCDPKQQRIRAFSPDGSTRTITPPDPIYRIAALGDVLITMGVPGNSKLFETYDLSGGQLKSFGELLEDQANTEIILDGNIVGDAESNGFIYGGRYVGVIGAYGADGKQRFLVKTIDGVTQSAVLDIEGKRKIKPNSTYSVLSISILGSELYVLSGVRADGTVRPGGKVIDVYNKRDGHYVYSWELPVACREAIMRPDYIYTRGDGEITVWRFKPNA